MPSDLHRILCFARLVFFISPHWQFTVKPDQNESRPPAHIHLHTETVIVCTRSSQKNERIPNEFDLQECQQTIVAKFLLHFNQIIVCPHTDSLSQFGVRTSDSSLSALYANIIHMAQSNRCITRSQGKREHNNCIMMIGPNWRNFSASLSFHLSLCMRISSLMGRQWMWIGPNVCGCSWSLQCRQCHDNYVRRKSIKSNGYKGIL